MSPADFQLSFFLLFFVSKTQAALFKTLDHGVEGDVKIESNTIVVELLRTSATTGQHRLPSSMWERADVRVGRELGLGMSS